jgi:hypothetical protein
MTTPNQEALDRLNPLYRIEFDSAPVRTWRVIWPDGRIEEVGAHALELDKETGTAIFRFNYLGPHRIINLAHVRDIAEQQP